MTTKTMIACLLVALPSFAFANPTIVDLQPETQVTITGIVDRITDEDTFVLKDDTGEIEVYLGPNLVPVAVGSTVTVNGMVDDGPIPEIYAQSLVTSDGEVITLDLSYD